MQIEQDIIQDIIGGTAVLRVTGETRERKAPGLLRRVDHLVRDGVVNVVIDVSGAKWCGAGLLGAMAESARILRRAGGDVRLAGLGPRMERILTVTGLRGVFRTFGSVEGALESFRTDLVA